MICSRSQHKLPGVSRLYMKLLIVISLVVSSTFLGGSNVHFIDLEVANFRLNVAQNPRGSADTRSLQKEANSEKDVHQRVGQEGNGEGRSDELPRDGPTDCCDKGAKEASVEEFLDPVGNTKDIALADDNVESSDTCNEKEAHCHTNLSSNHEPGKIVSIAAKEKLASLHSKLVVALFLLRKLRDSKEGNLHTLKHADNRHEDEE